MVVSEATLPQRAGNEEDWGHLAAEEAGALGAAAGAERLLLTHYWSETAEQLVAPASDAFGAEAELAVALERYGVA